MIIACLSLCSYKAFADMDGNVELCLNGNGKSCILAGHDYERINLDIKKAMIYYHHGCTIGYGLACLYPETVRVVIELQTLICGRLELQLAVVLETRDLSALRCGKDDE